MKRVKVKPSKASSALAGIVGTIFVILGVTTIIPQFGGFGIIWTLVAVGIAGYHIYNLTSKKGAGIYEVDIEDSMDSEDFETKLRKLKNLYDDGVITQEEYTSKKEEILREKW